MILPQPIQLFLPVQCVDINVSVHMLTPVGLFACMCLLLSVYIYVFGYVYMGISGPISACAYLEKLLY